jgi:GNAT superfamily N-acetyltransferase
MAALQFRRDLTCFYASIIAGTAILSPVARSPVESRSIDGLRVATCRASGGFPSIMTLMTLSDATLSKRLERVEGFACAQYAAARRRLFPDSGAEWMMYAGGYVVFDQVDSPATQTFGLGLFEELTPAALDVIEEFFRSRGAAVHHEISPLAGVAALQLLCSRGYRPIELSSVTFQPIREVTAAGGDDIRVREIGPDEAQVWAEVSARGWSHEHPELDEFLRRLSAIVTAREQSPAFLAEIDGVPGAAGSLTMHDGVALFGGAATVPELRRRGLQTALLQARLRYAHEHGCDLAMMVAAPGSDSLRNAERAGFRIAYTRTKWELSR